MLVRIAQLVARLVDELALALEGLVDPAEHPVEGVGQAPQLVVGPTQADPTGQVAGLDLVDRSGDLADGTQHPPAHQPTDDEAHEEQAHQRAERVGAQRLEGPLVGPALHELGEAVEVDATRNLDGHDVGRHLLVVERVRQTDVDAGDDEGGEPEHDARVDDRETEADRAEPRREPVGQPLAPRVEPRVHLRRRGDHRVLARAGFPSVGGRRRGHGHGDSRR
jgi:hypothetical protein